MDGRVVQGAATGQDWRTTPLWGLGLRSLLHDGRATNVPDAILAGHDQDSLIDWHCNEG
jgi:CxxC motif-containing protein (DUF1111 family)